MRKILIVFCCMAMFCLGACTTTMVSAEQTWPIKIWKQNENGCFTTLCVVDEDTGVNYIVVAIERGSAYEDIAICPRYNSDGTLYTG